MINDNQLRCRRFGITGTPRSGTHYMRWCFWKIGLRIGAEVDDGPDGQVSWMLAGQSPAVLKQKFEFLYHQVRNPINSIGSLQSFRKFEWEQVADEYGQVIPEPSGLRRCCWAWIIGNQMAEEKAVHTHRVEAARDFWPELLNQIGVEQQPFPDVNKKFNTRRSNYTPINWKKIKDASGTYYRTIKEMAERYGYEV